MLLASRKAECFSRPLPQSLRNRPTLFFRRARPQARTPSPSVKRRIRAPHSVVRAAFNQGPPVDRKAGKSFSVLAFPRVVFGIPPNTLPARKLDSPTAIQRLMFFEL